MQRLGIDYSVLSADNERLVMCSISGFGQTGPDAQRPAFAPVVQAWSGYDALTLKYQPGLDKPLNMGLPVADNAAALQAFGTINAARVVTLSLGHFQEGFIIVTHALRHDDLIYRSHSPQAMFAPLPESRRSKPYKPALSSYDAK
jgi:hypothetical protein